MAESSLHLKRRIFSYIYLNDLHGIETTASSPPSPVTVLASERLRQILEADPPQEYRDWQCFITIAFYNPENPHILDIFIPHVKESDMVPRT
jgi:hypothetical protein